MGNGGVEPLFSVARFRLLPVFRRLFALLFFVARVLETMARPSFRPRHPIPAALLLSTALLPPAAPGASPGEARGEPPPEIVILGVGEALEIGMGDMVRYSVTNGDAVSYRLLPGRSVLLLKGKAKGLSQVLVWGRSGRARRTTVFVHPRDERIYATGFIRPLVSLGLSLSFVGDRLEARGEIGTLGDYEAMAGVVNALPDGLVTVRVRVEPSVLKEAIALVYHDFFQRHRDSISCVHGDSDVRCSYHYFETPEEELEERFRRRFLIGFAAHPRKHPTNFRVTTRTVLVEGGRSLLADLGAERVSATVGELLESGGPASVLAREGVEVGGGRIRLHSLGEQESLVRLGRPLSIRVGTDTRHEALIDGEARIQWRFTGLAINLVLRRELERFFVDYETSLSSPASEERNTQNSKKSSFFVSLGRYRKVFEVRTSVEGLRESGVPLLKDAPVLGRLFASRSRADATVLYQTHVRIDRQ